MIKTNNIDAMLKISAEKRSWEKSNNTSSEGYTYELFHRLQLEFFIDEIIIMTHLGCLIAKWESSLT